MDAVVTERTPRDAVRFAGGVLLNVLEGEQWQNVSAICMGEVQRMAQDGVPLQQVFIDELQYSGTLLHWASRVSEAELNELRYAIAVAASSGASVELMILWSVIHDATKDALSSHYKDLDRAIFETEAHALRDLAENGDQTPPLSAADMLRIEDAKMAHCGEASENEEPRTASSFSDEDESSDPVVIRVEDVNVGEESTEDRSVGGENEGRDPSVAQSESFGEVDEIEDREMARSAGDIDEDREPNSIQFEFMRSNQESTAAHSLGDEDENGDPTAAHPANGASENERPGDAASSIDNVSENAESIGCLLQLAFNSSEALSSAISVELHDGVKEMVERGMLLAPDLVVELEIHASSIAEALPHEKLLELQAFCSQSASSKWSAIPQFASQVQESAVVEIADDSLLDGTSQTNSVADVFGTTAFAKSNDLEPFTHLDSAFTRSREKTENKFISIANGVKEGCFASLLAMLPPLLSLEILRDFCQTVSLFISNLYAPVLDTGRSSVVYKLQAFVRAICNIMSANFSDLWSPDRETLINAGYIGLFLLIVAGYVSFLWFVFSARHMHKRSDEIRQGHEGTTWVQLALTQQTRVKTFTWVITACLTIYLPLTRLSIEILVAASQEQPNIATSGDAALSSTSAALIKKRYGGGSLWGFLQFFAVLVLVTFTIPLPFMLIKAIKENKPTGSLENPLITYDLDGEQVPFDEKVYARLVAKDPAQLRCPYRSLYAGFGNKWKSYYKVFQLLFKFLLILFLVAIPQAGARGVLALIIYCSFAAVFYFGEPFSNAINFDMDYFGKCAALLTCLGGTILGFNMSSDTQYMVVGVVNGVNVIILGFMVTIFLFSMKLPRGRIKNWLGIVTFSDTVHDIQDGPAKNIVPEWDIEKEAKHRAWQAFWKSVLLSFDNETLVQRFDSLEQAVIASGVQNVKRHWDGQRNKYIAHMRMAARLMLEGVDVYWNDPTGTRDGHLDSKTCFGKMYIQPYPFHCVVVYDDAKDETIIRDDKFSEFLFVNFSPSVMSKRLLRQKLRALSVRRVRIHLPFLRQEEATIKDVVETQYTDSDGKTQTRTETGYIKVMFMCQYTFGIISVRTNPSSHVMAEGFIVTMTYEDGTGDAVSPRTGKVYRQENRVAEMDAEFVGLTHEMLESARLQQIFAQTQAKWTEGLAVLDKVYRQYRQQLIQKHNNSTQILSDGFWFFVYNNPYLERSALEQYLQTEERSSVLSNLPKTQRVALDFLYKRMEFIHSHPAIKFWFVFWEDVYARNHNMVRLKPFKADLDPLQPTSICYQVVSREELEVWLTERKLRGKPLSLKSILLCRKTLFHDNMIELLYDQLQKYSVVEDQSTEPPQRPNSAKVMPR